MPRKRLSIIAFPIPIGYAADEVSGPCSGEREARCDGDFGRRAPALASALSAFHLLRAF
jgi:hypothetical protein